MNKRPYPVVNIGSVLLLMIFIVLCLAVFSALSLSGSAGEYRYSQKLAKHNSDYYSACGRANEALRSIDDILNAAYTKHGSYSSAKPGLSALDGVAADFIKKTPSITYETPVNSSQTLRVVLALNPPDQTAEGYYKITSWQEVPASQWKGDDSLTLIK